MEKIKNFWTDHKKAIFVAGFVTGATLGVFIGRKLHAKGLVDLTGLDAITWTPSSNDPFIGLERVKEILDLNANTTAPFAIFREGPNPMDFICILLGDGVIV